MKLITKLLLVVLIAAMIPAAASATRMTVIDVYGDCQGWSAQLKVHFQVDHISVEGWWDAYLTDRDGNVLETISWSGELSRPEGSESVHFYDIGSEWTVFAEPDIFKVIVEGGVTYINHWGDQVYHEASSMNYFECGVVPTEDISWSSVKSLYE